MVGGSGLYVDAVLKGFDEFPEIDASVREELNTQFEQKGISFLQEKLKNVDPEYYSKLEVENPQTLENPQRLKRFVEVSLATGKPYSSFLNQKQNTRNFTPIVIGLQADRTIMYDRINQRVETMIENKLIEEALQLHPHQELNALQTVGYRELFQYFDHKIDLPTAIEEIKKNTRRFAKRQITWFKRTENAIWFDYNSQIQDIISKMDDLMK
jgi:tRNA dimethylallyltransferase